jgi:hypothetical protein
VFYRIVSYLFSNLDRGHSRIAVVVLRGQCLEAMKSFCPSAGTQNRARERFFLAAGGVLGVKKEGQRDRRGMVAPGRMPSR